MSVSPDHPDPKKIISVERWKPNGASPPTEPFLAGPSAAPTEAPRPLRREPPPGEPFPLDALGDVLGAAARAIVDSIMCPPAIAASSVLAAAALAVQAHADVVLPATGHARPLSLFVATVGESGERKSACDHEALWPIRRREATLREIYKDAIRDYRRAKRAFDAAISKAEKTKGDRHEIDAALRNVGDEPIAPLEPELTCDDPTIEGLYKALIAGQPSVGLFSDEGGVFIGGHAMSDDARLRTAAGLSKLWDGSPVKGRRVGDGSRVLPGRRLAIHLLAQPEAMARMLSDPELTDQGLLSRMLVASPASTIGARFQRPCAPQTDAALKRYGARLLDILEEPLPLVGGVDAELAPRRLEFDEEAAARWLAICDIIEGALAAGGTFDPIRGFGNKLAENIARIAGVLTLVDDLRARAIGIEALEAAYDIGGFYAGEALRLFEAGACSPEVRKAEKLLDWLKTTWREPMVGLATIYQLGPNAIRSADAARKAVAILADHGWLVPVEGKATVAGKPVREAWKIVREG